MCVSLTLLCLSDFVVCFGYFVVFELCFCESSYFAVFELHKFVCREFYELKVPAVTPLLANYNHPCLTQ